MATYMIFIREGTIVDHEAMAAYQSGNRGANAAASAMKPLVVYGELETLEGDAADGVVVLQFPDRDAAKAWYFSPEYQEKVKLRQKAAPYRCLMVEGL
ncbi:DUF1330 domain-containing protein [Novosphingobium sp.]|uniref:DUF1330 domain-containing protein n=1 Tax=Novosphingobium sp. TaxID=1874826 RepID=UPI00286E8CC2|nr:DUF1330 domain-containing protein [Novosphingobium sp.]